MPGGENNKWHWPDASPVVRCVVWAGVGGDHLPYEEFVDSMAEAFDVDRQGVDYLQGRLGAKFMLNDVIPRLQRLGPGELSSATTELGKLAGGGDHAEGIAAEAGEQLREGKEEATQEAALTLRSLSTMAAARVARKRGHKGWRLAA
jgi:hypothetical protein